MLFRVGGKVFAESPEGKHPYTEVEVRIVDGAKAIVSTAGGIETLPADAYPMTYDECIANMEVTETKAKPRRKGGEKGVSDIQ